MLARQTAVHDDLSRSMKVTALKILLWCTSGQLRIREAQKRNAGSLYTFWTQPMLLWGCQGNVRFTSYKDLTYSLAQLNMRAYNVHVKLSVPVMTSRSGLVATVGCAAARAIYFLICICNCVSGIKKLFGDTENTQVWCDGSKIHSLWLLHCERTESRHVFWVGTPGALASDQPMKPQQRGQAGVCICVFVCVWGVVSLGERLLL